MAQIVMRLMASGPKGSLIYAEESKLTLLVLARETRTTISYWEWRRIPNRTTRGSSRDDNGVTTDDS